MKSRLLTIVVTTVLTAAATYLLTRRTNSNSPHHSMMQAQSVANSLDSVTVAKADVGRFNDSFFSWFHVQPMVAFTLNSTDLMAATGVDTSLIDTMHFPYDQIRVYIGLDTANKIKLYIASVSGCQAQAKGDPNVFAGRDYYYDTSNGVLQHAQQGNFILDLNMPCPNYCNFISRIVPVGNKGSHKK